jgi:predicted MFS family arabinose efflux permease
MLGQNVGWPLPYWVVGAVGALTVLAVWAWSRGSPSTRPPRCAAS